MRISDKGLDFVVRHEGFVSKAYRDQGGVWTIGTGFTNASKIFREMYGRSITTGSTITREQNDRTLEEAFAREYGPPAERAMPGALPHQFDCGCSYSFNAGPAAVVEDEWTSLFRKGHLHAAAERLKRTRITARGKPSAGLENRRKAEARLLQYGDYGDGLTASHQTPKGRAPDPVLVGYQGKLKRLSYYAGDVDGWHGPKTTAAVLAFQKHHASLVDDGVLGPATRAQIDRDLKAKGEAKGVGVGTGATVVGLGAAAWFADHWHWLALGIVAVVAGVAAVFIVRRREEVAHWISNLRHRRT